jgi:hypothetical protein
VNAPAMGDLRRTQSHFPGADQGRLNGDGEEQIGFADVVVVKEIYNAVAEGVGVEHPAAPGNDDAKLEFFIALAMEIDKGGVIPAGKLQERAGGGDERWSLVVVSVEVAQSPVEVRDGNSGAEARANGALGDAAVEKGGPGSCGQGKARTQA